MLTAATGERRWEPTTEPPFPANETTVFDWSGMLSIDAIRSHTKTDLPGVTDEQLKSYRAAATEAATPTRPRRNRSLVPFRRLTSHPADYVVQRPGIGPQPEKRRAEAEDVATGLAEQLVTAVGSRTSHHVIGACHRTGSPAPPIGAVYDCVMSHAVDGIYTGRPGPVLLCEQTG